MKKRSSWASKNDLELHGLENISEKLELMKYPNLSNVIKGEMSIIGQGRNAEIDIKLNKEISFYSFRHLVKPGITGDWHKSYTHMVPA